MRRKMTLFLTSLMFLAGLVMASGLSCNSCCYRLKIVGGDPPSGVNLDKAIYKAMFEMRPDTKSARNWWTSTDGKYAIWYNAKAGQDGAWLVSEKKWAPGVQFNRHFGWPLPATLPAP